MRDIIEVCPGTYVEQVEITKPLSLVGIRREGKKAAVVQPSNMIVNPVFFGVAAAILVQDTSDVTIRNITVDGINNGVGCEPGILFLDGILYLNASGAIESVAIRNMRSPQGCAVGTGIDVESTEGGRARVTVRDSSMHDNDFGGIFGYGPGTNLRAIRNVITGLGPTDFPQAGIQFAGGGATGVIEENIVTNHVFGPCSISPSACEFVSHGIGVFVTEDVRIVRNIVGKSNTGIFAGAFGEIASNGVRVLENRVFDTDVFNGIVVGEGENNVVKDNIITNSDRAGVFVGGTNNTIRDNTINEAAIGLFVRTGNNFSDNLFFNTPVVQEVFDPGAPLASSQRALRPDPTVRSLLRRKPPR